MADSQYRPHSDSIQETITSSPEYNWSDEDTVVRTQMAIGVYTNRRGDIVIRQADAMGEDDQIIFISIVHAEALIKAIRAQVKMVKETGR